MTDQTTTIENLRESLKQALEERRQSEQKIGALRKSFSDSIADLQAMESTLQSLQPSAQAAVPPVAVQPDAQPQADQSQKVINTVRETVADILKGMDGNAATQSTTAFGKVFWQYIVPAAIMFAVIWFIAAHFKAPEAKACAIVDRVQARVAARQESRASSVPSVTVVNAGIAAEPPAKVDTAANPNTAKVHLAIIDLIMDLNTLDRQCASGQDSMLLFEEVTDKWTTLKELIQPEDVIPELAPADAVPQPEQPSATAAGTAAAEVKQAACAGGTCVPAARAPTVRRGLFRAFR